MVVTLLVAEAAMVELIPPGESRVTLTPLAYQFLVSKPRNHIAYKIRCRRSLRHFVLQLKRSEYRRKYSVPRYQFFF
jgi:hypothetical protein